MSYQNSIEFWSKWGAVPLDCAVTLALGEDPEDFDGYETQDFIFLKALAISHATSCDVRFKAPNNSKTWFDDPVVFLPEFGEWAETVGWKLRDEYPRTALNQAKSLLEVKSYFSNDLNTLNKAAFEFWSTADQDDKSTHPTNDQVKTWLKKQGFSDISARQGAVIIRPEWAAKGRR